MPAIRKRGAIGRPFLLRNSLSAWLLFGLIHLQRAVFENVQPLAHLVTG